MSRPVVLVLAESDDVTADLVVEAVRDRGGEVVRIDTADYPNALSLTARPDSPHADGYLTTHGRRLGLRDVRSVYRRRPARFAFPEGMSAPERKFATFETLHGLAGVLAVQPWHWIDRPDRVADAAYKTRQLPVAVRCGLRVPHTLVTDDPAEARRFAAEIGDLVYKTLAAGIVAEQDALKIVYTARVTADDLDDDAIRRCLHLFQRWIPKTHDGRLTVVRNRCFAVAIHAHSPESMVFFIYR